MPDKPIKFEIGSDSSYLDIMNAFNELIIFDLDGTLVNSIPDIAFSLNRVLEQHGYPTHPESDYLAFVGNGARKIVERAVPQGTSAQTVTALLQEFNTCYAGNCCSSTYAYKGMEKLLQQLAGQSYRLGVLSNKPEAMTHDVVRHCFPNQHFDCIAGALPEFPLKPDPTRLRHIANDLGISLKRTILVGDSDADCITAANAPCPFVAVTWGYRNRDILTQSGAKVFADTAEQLPALLTESLRS